MASTPDQLLDQTVRHQIYLERLKAGEVDQVNEFLQKLNDQISHTLMRSDITAFTRSRLNNQLRVIKEAMESGIDDYKAIWLGAMEGLAEYEATFEINSLRKIVVNKEFDLPTKAQIGAAVFTRPLQVEGASGGKLLEGLFDDWSQSAIDRVEGAILIGYAQGQTNRQIQQSIMGTAANQYKDGTLAQLKRMAEGTTRTAIQHVAMQARQATWERNSDVVKGVKWLSTLDRRTSPQCRSLDGMVFPLDKGPRPPAHFRCRSTTVAVLDDRYSFLDDGGTRRERDPATGQVGYVDANETYYTWLKRQPERFQDDILGPTRARLLRDGGLSAERFAELQLNKNFEPLNLDQMRTREPLAFERAGI